MKSVGLMLAVLLVAGMGGLAWWFGVGGSFGGEAASDARVVEYELRRGTVVDVLREVGELAPKDPLLVQAPFAGAIKWLVSDGSWVEADEKVVEFEEEDLVKTVADLRAAVVDKKQELRLARLQAEQTKIAEEQRVEIARQDFELASIRHRILTTMWRGGDALLELDRRIRPLEARLEGLQEEVTPLETRYREARDRYQEALQEWQTARGDLLELRMGSTLVKSKGEAGESGESDAGEEEAGMSVEEAEALAGEKEEVLDEARGVYESARVPYEAKVAEMDAIDEEAKELYILIEIEKRGLPAVRLEIDKAQSELRLAEARRQVESGRRAFAAGAMSKVRLDQLVADETAKRGQLEILQHRLEIARRPAKEDAVARSEASLASARRAVENAEEIFQREMDILAGDEAVIEAQLAQAIGRLERNGKGFETAIEGNIRMLRAELDLLDAGNVDRRAELQRELAGLEEELEASRESPPNLVRAPMPGLLRLREKDDRLTDIGDKYGKGETVAMLYPPGQMDVKVGINEVNVRRVAAGMRCRVRIPALDMVIEDAVVEHVSRIGKDRVQDQSRWTTRALSGITEFAISVDLRREGEAFRQGMTVLLEIETERREDVLWLPAAAVWATGDGAGTFEVQVDEEGTRKAVEGEFFGDDQFIVTGGAAGLSEGDVVLRVYPGEAK